ncbi:hypothetical protein J4413_03110 [Candidatus Woesearchaeota archaeon]|nr:hypothetical protein [Candidatus Woesearchaeota archaeon]
MRGDNLDGIPILGDMHIKQESKEKSEKGVVKGKKASEEKEYYKCMDCNFKFRDFGYKDRPRCPYCANNNTVKSESFFDEIL